MRLIPLVPRAIGARPVGTLPAAWCWVFFFFLAATCVGDWFSVLDRVSPFTEEGRRRSTGLDGEGSLGVNGSGKMNWDRWKRKGRGADFNWGGWRHAMAAAAKRRSVEAFMLLAVDCSVFFFFWRGEEEGGDLLVRGHLFPLQKPRRVRYRGPPVGWNQGGGSGGSGRRVVEMERCGSVWDPVLVPLDPPVSPLQEPLRPGAKGSPGGGGVRVPERGKGDWD